MLGVKSGLKVRATEDARKKYGIDMEEIRNRMGRIFA